MTSQPLKLQRATFQLSRQAALSLFGLPAAGLPFERLSFLVTEVESPLAYFSMTFVRETVTAVKLPIGFS